jgi:hypothetical protein
LAMNTNVIRYLREKTKTTALDFSEYDYSLIPGDTVAQGWTNEIWDTILLHFYNMLQVDDTLSADEVNSLTPVRLCFDDNAMAAMRGTIEYISSTVFAAARESITSFLSKREQHLCVLFANMDEYPMYTRIFGLSMKGFLTAINLLASPGTNLKIVFMLPEELLKQFYDSSANILKDFAQLTKCTGNHANCFRLQRTVTSYSLARPTRNIINRLSQF